MTRRSTTVVTAVLLLAPLLLHAQGADAVESFTPGSGQNVGQGPEYFPQNVLGPPDTSARPWLAVMNPQQILSLGLGGQIVLRFDAEAITDGPGADFTVFENAFIYSIGGRDRVYAEPGEVAVSRDGVNFIAFPFDTLTLEGCAGVTPVNGDADPTNPATSGGDSFDLSELGIDSVRYVRIRDVTSVVKNNREHPYWDPTLSGFDLDAVVIARHDVSVAAVESAADAGAEMAVVGANPFSRQTRVAVQLGHASNVRLRIVDAIGQVRISVADGHFEQGIHLVNIDGSHLMPGAYRLVMEIDGLVGASVPLVVVR